MPNYYAHLKFGDKVLEELPRELAGRIGREEAAFHLGCLGPDPLFFYHPIRPNGVRREGVRMHRASALPAAERLRQAIEDGVPMAAGYGAGFLCHLALDSACHGYVDSRAADGPISHMAIEGEYDRMLMERDGLDASEKAHLPASPADRAVWEAASMAFVHASPEQMRRAYRSMNFYSSFLARSNGRVRGKVIGAVSHMLPIPSSPPSSAPSRRRPPSPTGLTGTSRATRPAPRSTSPGPPDEPDISRLLNGQQSRRRKRRKTGRQKCLPVFPYGVYQRKTADPLLPENGQTQRKRRSSGLFQTRLYRRVRSDRGTLQQFIQPQQGGQKHQHRGPQVGAGGLCRLVAGLPVGLYRQTEEEPQAPHHQGRGPQPNGEDLRQHLRPRPVPPEGSAQPLPLDGHPPVGQTHRQQQQAQEQQAPVHRAQLLPQRFFLHCAHPLTQFIHRKRKRCKRTRRTVPVLVKLEYPAV